MSVYKKLATIQAKVKGLQKNQKAYNYDYVTGDKLLSVVRPLMDELGLLLMPEVTGINATPITYDVYDRGSRAMVQKTEVFTNVSMRMNWVDSEDGEVITQQWAATGQNGFDKGFGSALTYGERYYLLKLFHLQTDKDDVDTINAKRDEEMEETYRQKAKPKRELTEDMFQKFIDAERAGKKSKSGLTSRESFIKLYAPDEKTLKEFDELVAE